jgi:hypothetical protein
MSPQGPPDHTTSKRKEDPGGNLWQILLRIQETESNQIVVAAPRIEEFEGQECPHPVSKAPLPVEPEVPELETEMVYYCHRNSKDKLRKDV